jgi:hypothetical protein
MDVGDPGERRLVPRGIKRRGAQPRRTVVHPPRA